MTSTNTYTTSFFATCPNNGIRVHYHLSIVSETMLGVEEIITAVQAITSGFHEDIAEALLPLGGRQTLKADHHGVHITTYREAWPCSTN